MKTKLIYPVYSEKELFVHQLKFNRKLDKEGALKEAIEISEEFEAHYNKITKSLKHRLEIEEMVVANSNYYIANKNKMKLSTRKILSKIKMSSFKKQLKDWIFKLFEEQIMTNLSLQPFRVADGQVYKIVVIKSREYIRTEENDYAFRQSQHEARLNIKQTLSREAWERVMFTEDFHEPTEIENGYIEGHLVLGFKIDPHNSHLNPPFRSKQQ